MEDKQMITPCGLNCATCEIYTRYDGKDPRALKPLLWALTPVFRVLSVFSETSAARQRVLQRILSIPKDEPLCRGCRNEEGRIPLLGGESTCPIYACTQEKGIHNCSECDDFPCEHLYPKKFLADILPHNTKLVNCCLIRKYGLETWTDEHAEQVKEHYFHGKLPFEV